MSQVSHLAGAVIFDFALMTCVILRIALTHARCMICSVVESEGSRRLVTIVSSNVMSSFFSGSERLTADKQFVLGKVELGPHTSASSRVGVPWNVAS